MQLRHAHKAGVGEVPRIASYERFQGRDLVLQPERRLHDAPGDQLQNSLRPAGHPPNQVGCLRKNSLAGQQGRRQPVQLLRGPVVVAIAAVEEGDEGPRIDDSGPQRP